MPPAGARCAALGAIIELAWGATQLRAAGIESTLRHLVEFGVGPSSGGGIGAGGVDKGRLGIARAERWRRWTVPWLWLRLPD